MRIRLDDQILAAFEDAFPEIATSDEGLKRINEDDMKSPEGKTKWRAMMSLFEKSGEAYSILVSPRIFIDSLPHDSGRLQFWNADTSRL